MFHRSILLGLVCSVAAACVSSGDGGANYPAGVSSSTVAPSMLFLLTREGTAPSGNVFVLATGDWVLTSTDACAGTKGVLTSAELSTVRGYVSDPAVDRLPSTCSQHAFSLQVPRPKAELNVCWDDTTSPVAPTATAGLAKFFDERMAQIAWDGQVKDCPKGPPPVADTGKPLDPSKMPAPEN